MENGFDSLTVSLEANDKVLLKRLHSVTQDAHAVKQIADHDWLEDVELKVTVHSRNGSGDMVAHNLGADHGERFALGRVDLSRHDRGTGLVLGELELTKTAARAGAEETDVLGDLEERGGKGVESSGSLDDSIVSGKDFKLVW